MLKIAERKLNPYWEVHLWMDDGNYWTALKVDDNRGPVIHNEDEAKKLALKAVETYGAKHMLRLVKYTPEIVPAI